MDNKTKGAASGAMSGAAMGAASGLPGIAIGAVTGGALGYFASDNSSGPSLPWDQYNQRLADITDYQNQLTGAQNSWTTAISNYNTTMMNLATPNLLAAAGARGLNADSGAVAAEVARQASAYQAQGTTEIAKQNFSNINNVEKAKGDAWAAMFGLAGRNNQLGWGNSNDASAGVTGMFGQAGQAGMKGWQDYKAGQAAPKDNPIWASNYKGTGTYSGGTINGSGAPMSTEAAPQFSFSDYTSNAPRTEG